MSLCNIYVATLSINDNIKFLERIKQGFKRTVPLNRCRSEMRTQLKNNNLDYTIDATFRNNYRLFFLSFENGGNDAMRNSIDEL